MITYPHFGTNSIWFFNLPVEDPHEHERLEIAVKGPGKINANFNEEIFYDKFYEAIDFCDTVIEENKSETANSIANMPALIKTSELLSVHREDEFYQPFL